MEQGLYWEANRFSASQEILRILWNPKVHSLIHKSPPTARSIQAMPTHSTSRRSISVLSYLLVVLPSGLLHWGLSTCTHLSCVPHMTRPFHSWFDHSSNMLWEVQIIKLLVKWSSPLPCYLVPLRSTYFPHYPILEPLGLGSSLNLRDQVSHTVLVLCASQICGSYVTAWTPESLAFA